MIRPRLLQSFLLLVVLALATAGCDSVSEQRTFEAEASMPPAGITHTDMDGNVVGQPDTDDWRTSPLFPSVTVQPAYPNPVPAAYTGTVRIPISVPFTGQISGGLRLVAWDPRPPSRVGVLDEIPPHAVFEFVELSFSLADLRAGLQLADARGLYRLHIRDGAGRLISYGDVRVD